MDEQFAVLVRLVTLKVNEFSSKHNKLLVLLEMALDKEVTEDLHIQEVSYDDINAMFVDWQTFKERSDWRDHSSVWYTGGNLDSLPPEPEAKKEEVVEAIDGSEDVQQFGGDYNDASDSGDQPAQEAGSEGPKEDEADEVPQVQQPHPASPEYEGEKLDTKVPELRE